MAAPTTSPLRFTATYGRHYERYVFAASPHPDPRPGRVVASYQFSAPSATPSSKAATGRFAPVQGAMRGVSAQGHTVHVTRDSSGVYHIAISGRPSGRRHGFTKQGRAQFTSSGTLADANAKAQRYGMNQMLRPVDFDTIDATTAAEVANAQRRAQAKSRVPQATMTPTGNGQHHEYRVNIRSDARGNHSVTVSQSRHVGTSATGTAGGGTTGGNDRGAAGQPGTSTSKTATPTSPPAPAARAVRPTRPRPPVAPGSAEQARPSATRASRTIRR